MSETTNQRYTPAVCLAEGQREDGGSCAWGLANDVNGSVKGWVESVRWGRGRLRTAKDERGEGDGRKMRRGKRAPGDRKLRLCWRALGPLQAEATKA